jgi:transposase
MPEELAREFEPTAQSISTWVKQAERDAGERADGPGWSNGQTEGQICKLKLVKRQMYGSGKPDLLQVRVVGLT